ncbi:hypothetical protein FQ082_12460 [Psychrobacter sp. ANT_H56B]|uniref:hypothetical protein n=1 Tax=Psychrobacter sp. ANT_H56B TaxID=2597353 RepID=UPI0011F31B42|nr:hypothetical protein [Psychrobacter sp. ANT_H56B]KAA0922121.1 hypothetical protein FQ082_12460 [Psychrobacter sp. ANT_H56B]
MSNDKELSVYELGVIKNSLRERLITIEEVRTYSVPEEYEEKLNEQVDAFRLDLVAIKDKIEVMILTQLDEKGGS